MSEMRHTLDVRTMATISHAISDALASPGEPVTLLTYEHCADRLLEASREFIEKFSSQLGLSVEPVEQDGRHGVVIKSGRGDGGPMVEDGS